MKITNKVEKFCQSVVSGMSNADAYRNAYNTSKMKAETIQNNAYKLNSDNDVITRIDFLRKELESKALWTREESVIELKKVLEMPDNSAAQIAAVKELNAMHGYNAPTKLELSGKVTLESLVAGDVDK
jgi:hypothetical protein